jgi:hypothetical protein
MENVSNMIASDMELDELAGKQGWHSIPVSLALLSFGSKSSKLRRLNRKSSRAGFLHAV